MIALENNGLFVGHENVWSDWALHIGLATLFAEKDPAFWFAYHPVFADGKMTYPFVVNLISSIFMRLGFGLSFSFIFPSILMAVFLVEGSFRLWRIIFQSELTAFLGVTFFFMSSGLGFIDYFSDLLHSQSFWGQIFPTKQYGRLGEMGWLAGNFIVGHLLPQRGFLLGMTVSVWSLVLFFTGLKSHRKKYFLGSAFLASFLPIIHMHSLIALVLLMTPVIFFSKQRLILFKFSFLPIALGSGVLYWVFVQGGIQSQRFITVLVGYTSKNLKEWLFFWGKIFGLMTPLAILGLLAIFKQDKISREMKLFFLGFFTIFILSNIILYQPTQWDNSKLFLWCYFGFSILAAHCLVNWYHGCQIHSGRFRVFGRFGIGVLVLCLTFTGLLELLLLQRIDFHRHQLMGREEWELAEVVRKNTGPLDRFLAAKDHNHWVMVRAARPVLLGYPGWAHNYGLNYSQTERDMDSMFRGDPNARDLLKKYRLKYVVLGPSEQHHFRPNQEFWKQFPIAFQAPRTTILRVD